VLIGICSENPAGSYTKRYGAFKKTQPMKFLLTFLWLLIFIFSACKVENINGLYRTKSGFEWGSSLEINPDSTFIYHWSVSMDHGLTTGRWQRNKNLLILNSEKQPKPDTLPNFKIKSQYETKSDSLNVKIFLSDSTFITSSVFYLLYKNGKENAGVVKAINGNVSFLKQDFDSLRILGSNYRDISLSKGYKDVVLYSKTINNLEIILRIAPDWGYEYFSNRVIEIKNRRLISTGVNVYYQDRYFRKVKK